MIDIKKDSRFAGITPFGKKIWLASPTMHGEKAGEIIGTTNANLYKSSVYVI